MRPGIQVLTATALAIALAGSPAADPSPPPDTIFVGGAVLTVDETRPVARGVAVAAGRIVEVGAEDEIRALAGPETRVVELAGRALVPGFVDSHSHLVLASQTLAFMADLNAPPIGRVHTVEQALAALRAQAERTPPGQWIVGMGYDDTLLAERRHLDRRDLDLVSRQRPVLAIHVSGHFYAANSAALELAGIDADTPDPEGGVIRRDPDSGKPDGVLEEIAAALPLLVRMPARPREARLEALERMAHVYASRGVTTAQDGAAGLETIGDLQALVRTGGMPIRVVALPTADAVEPLLAGELADPRIPGERLTLGPVKLVADGSIQGFTGYLSRPYHTPFQGDPDYRGYPTLSGDALAASVARLHAAGLQLAIHGNGDAAIDAILTALEAALHQTPHPDPRLVVIHAQMAREDQLDQMLRLGATPSFFALHTYYWGDRHRDVFIGPERARRISPARSARERELRFSIHTDAPVVPMDVLKLMATAIDRRTTSGEVLGPEQRLTPDEALRAVTLDAAWQYRLEDSRGSIEPGKLADLVVLSADPSRRAVRIDQLRVDQTWVGGKRVFERPLPADGVNSPSDSE